MPRPSSPSILAQFPSLLSPDTRAAALRALKNELIGHDEKKEVWVRSGVLKPLATVISSTRSPDNRATKRSEARSEQEEARLQAIIVVGSLAQGGPAYTSPIYDSGCLSPLLNALSLKQSSPKTLTAALKTLNTIADSRLLQHPLHIVHPDTLADLLYTAGNVEKLVHILSQESPSWNTQQQISLAANLLSKTCREERHRKLVEEAGLYDALATKLVSFIVATGCSLPSSNGSRNEPLYPAPERAELAPILDAIITFMDKSKTRWNRFLAAPAFEAVFPKTYPEGPTNFNARKSPSNYVESLIPHLQSPTRSQPNSKFPPLGAIGTSLQPSLTSFSWSTEDAVVENHESALVPWLVYMARADPSGFTRLMALQAVTQLHRCGLTHKRREAEFATVLVPLLVVMLSGLRTDIYARKDIKSDNRFIEERAPAVLAALTVDSLDLQRAAIEAGSIKKLSQILKKSFDSLPPHSTTSLWSPEPPEDGMETNEEVLLGSPGLSPAAYHVTRMREAALTGLAAIASLNDEYRKSIIENGVVPFIIQSLKPYAIENPSNQPRPSLDDAKASVAVNENPKDVMMAACSLARGLTRSVSNLRTSLVDAGLAAPLFSLLKHHDIDIQVAATAVVCNLVLDFSPMREAIIEAGVLQVLCDHAHSMNSKLLLNSIWALKHLVLNANNALKRKCLNELGPGWLKQIICSGTEDLHQHTPSSTPHGMQTPNAAGMQVDILNAVESSTSTQDEDSEGDVRMSDTEPTRPKPIPGLSTTNISSNADDLAIQKEGLEFIRNLICGHQAYEMIDHLFDELGQDKFFELLASKIRGGVPQHAYNRRSGGTKANSISMWQYNQAHGEIIASVGYILVHLAAGHPKHRNKLAAQTDLLKLVVPLFQHQNHSVRTCCAWLVINLTFIENNEDTTDCRARTRALVNLGFAELVKLLEGDANLDCRERARIASHQIRMMTHEGR